jgi:GNAT superfamily N-acetyltransferase
VEHARQADATELELIAEMWSEAVAELDGQRGGSLLAGSLAREDLVSELQRFHADADRILVVGMLDAATVGFASVFCDRHRREPVASIEVIYVQPAARQVGVAEAVVSVVMEWALERHCVGVDAPALPGNRPSKAFFEDNGFTARLLVMHHPLGAVEERSGG